MTKSGRRSSNRYSREKALVEVECQAIGTSTRPAMSTMAQSV